MQKLLRWRLVLGACALACALTGRVLAEEKPAAGAGDKDHKSLVDVLRDVHNRGADLYNGGDPAGCYRMFQGAFLTVKPLVGADLQKIITDGLTKADSDPRTDRRAFMLHETIEAVRTKLKPPGAAKSPDKKPVETKPPDKKPVVKPPPAPKTLWDRLGGGANVKKVVDDFVATAAADPKVNFDRNGKYKLDAAAVAHLKKELIDFISAATGGPHKYTGKSMKEVHKGMGITDAEFNALAGHLKNALEKNGAAPADEDAVMAAVGGTRKDIVEPKKPEDKKPPEKKPEDKKPEDKKPEGKKPEDKKPAEEKKPVDKKPPEDKKPEDKKPEDKKSALLIEGEGVVAEEEAEEKKPAEKKGDASVQGKVTYNGTPLPSGTVALVDDEGKSISGKVLEDGTFEVKGVKPGKYKVTVTGGDAVKLPEKYAAADKSGLAYEVKKGKQTFDIELK